MFKYEVGQKVLYQEKFEVIVKQTFVDCETGEEYYTVEPCWEGGTKLQREIERKHFELNTKVKEQKKMRKAIKEKSKTEKYAEKWLKENGFKFEVLKQYILKTVYQVEKDGFVDKLEIPSIVADCKKYMKMIGEDFKTKQELRKLRSML